MKPNKESQEYICMYIYKYNTLTCEAGCREGRTPETSTIAPMHCCCFFCFFLELKSRARMRVCRLDEFSAWFDVYWAADPLLVHLIASWWTNRDKKQVKQNKFNFTLYFMGIGHCL